MSRCQRECRRFEPDYLLQPHLTKGNKMSAHNEINAQLEAYLVEHEKFEKGNSAAGTRARKALGELAKAVKARRNEITAEKAARAEAKKAQ
jgi:hypothetical protein